MNKTLHLVRFDHLLSDEKMTAVAAAQETRAPPDSRIVFAAADEVNACDKNIQVAELNALKAAFAVLKCKRLFGFYDDGHAITFGRERNLV